MQAYVFKAICTNVVDGDTIDCVIDLGFGLKATHRLRLYGINTPEKRSLVKEERRRALQAEAYTTNLVLGKEIMVQTYKSDVFGRYLAKVFVALNIDEREFSCLNDLLVEERLAESYMTDTDLLQ